MNHPMHCTRLSATIPRATCIARQKKANHGHIPQISLMPRLGVDPGCATCPQGIDVANALGITINRPGKKTHKNCTDCGKRLPLASFPETSLGQSSDWHLSICRKCQNIRSRKNYTDRVLRKAGYAD